MSAAWGHGLNRKRSELNPLALSMYDVVIIGAGMSGLAAGIRLAMFDRRVCILERHYAIGGLNSYYRLDGRNFDVGLHALTNFSPARRQTWSAASTAAAVATVVGRL